jgi:cytochrome c biogenesis protein
LFGVTDKAVDKTELDNHPFYQKNELNKGDMDSNMLYSLIQYNLVRRLFYRLKFSNEEKSLYYFEKGLISRLGPIITHASIIIIIIGGIVVGFTGFKEHRNIPVGEVISVPNADFKAKAEDFKIEFYPDSNTPKQYITKLTIIENGNPAITKDIMVNHPLKYKGIKFFQSAYGVINTIGVELSKEIADGSKSIIGEYSIEENSSVKIPDTNLEIKLLSYVPDFVMDDSGHVSSRSSQPRNPAVLLELFDNNQSKGKAWKFLKYPSFKASPESEYIIEFVSIFPSKYYTRLQISRDSGISIIWIGSILMIIGLFITFFFSHKRFWVKFSSENNINVLEIAGTSYKNRSGFEKESDLILRLLQK